MTFAGNSLIALLAAITLTAGISASHAATRGDVADELRARGYHSIRIADERGPGYRALACKGKGQYLFDVSESGRIMRRKPAGRCGSRKGVHIRVPFVSVDVDRGVRVRVPFVDIRIPRR